MYEFHTAMSEVISLSLFFCFSCVIKRCRHNVFFSNLSANVKEKNIGGALVVKNKTQTAHWGSLGCGSNQTAAGLQHSYLFLVWNWKKTTCLNCNLNVYSCNIFNLHQAHNVSCVWTILMHIMIFFPWWLNLIKLN